VFPLSAFRFPLFIRHTIRAGAPALSPVPCSLFAIRSRHHLHLDLYLCLHLRIYASSGHVVSDVIRHRKLNIGTAAPSGGRGQLRIQNSELRIGKSTSPRAPGTRATGRAAAIVALGPGRPILAGAVVALERARCAVLAGRGLRARRRPRACRRPRAGRRPVAGRGPRLTTGRRFGSIAGGGSCRGARRIGLRPAAGIAAVPRAVLVPAVDVAVAIGVDVVLPIFGGRWPSSVTFVLGGGDPVGVASPVVDVVARNVPGPRRRPGGAGGKLRRP